MNDRLLTAKEVADLIQVDRSTVSRWAKAGTLPSLKIGDLLRFRPSDIEAFINAHRRTPQDAA